MVEVAKGLENPLVVADNDPVGVTAAKKIAPRYWVGGAGEDFNDFELRAGTEEASKSIAEFL